MGGRIKIICLFVLFSFSLHAQTEELRFEGLTVEQGLSANSILSTLQDSRGFLWIGTMDGLNRYDGYKFTVYKNIIGDSTSISENMIRSMYEDKAGTLWIGTWGGGLNKFDREKEKFTHFKHDSTNPNSLSHDAVISICEDNLGYLWVGTGGGLNKLNRKNKQFTHYTYNPDDTSSISDNKILSLYKDGNDILWIGTAGGLNKLQLNNKQETPPDNNSSVIDNEKSSPTFIRYMHNPNDVTSLSNNVVVSIYEDNFGILWIGTHGGGLNKFDRENEKFTRYINEPQNGSTISGNNVYSIYEDNSGDLWFGTYGNGLNKFNRATEEFIHYAYDPNNPTSINDNGIFSICQDDCGILWFGTWGGLNNYYKRKNIITYKYIPGDPKSLSDNQVSVIFEDKLGVTWIGTVNGGLNRLDGKSKGFTHFIHDPNNPYSISNNSINSICEDESGMLWIGTDGGGINKFDRKTNKFYSYSSDPDDPSSLSNNQVYQIFADHNGDIWIGARGGGLNKFDKENERFIRYTYNPDDPNGLGNDLVFAMFEDKRGVFWIGTYGGGLNKFNRETNTFTRYLHSSDNPTSLSNNNVSKIYEDKKGVLWVGTQGGGLNKFNREKNQFKHYTQVDGLPNEVIYGILEDDIGNLWISTNNGLSKFNPNTETFRNYDVKDGLQSNEFNMGAFKSKNGAMYFGGNNGVNVFYPDNIKDNTQIPKIVITDFQLFHRSVPVGYDEFNNRSILEKSIMETKEIEINYEDNIISFEFTALDFHAPEKNRYAYIMEGFEEDWNYTDASRRFVTYTNLDPGEYYFKVKGSNNDGVWNEEGTSLRIILTPPWWATWWSYILYGVFAIGLFSALTRFYLNRQRLRHQLELEHEHSEKLEEVDQIKSRFFANISHEFRTPLTLILGPSESIITETLDEKTKKKAGSIKRNANRLLNLINQLLDLSKLEAGRLKLETSFSNIVTFVKGVAMSFESLAERKDIILKVKSSNDEIGLYFDKEKMEKVFTNLLSNAFKFTPGGSKITISVKETENNSVEIKVKDSGIGIPEKELPKLFDRFYQVDNSRTRERGGTGLGLALTKELVELHLGSIKVESEEKKETVVTITLPLGKEHLLPEEIVVVDETPEEGKILVELEEEGESTSLQVDKPLPEEIAKDKTIILIVEDNAEVRDYIKDSLESEYFIVEATNGEQGLRKAENIIPDLIISDIMMPKMDGNELTRRLKNDERTSHIPIILLTAKSEQESKLEGLETGAEAYLTKPFDTKELQIRIKNLINLRRKLQQKYSSDKIVTTMGELKKVSGLDEKFMKKAMEVIEKHISEETFSIEDFGKEVGMSRMQIHRKLKALTGKSASHYIRSVKLFKAKEMIGKHETTISEIAYSLGFSSPAYFTRCFKEEYGHPPSDLVD